MLAIEVGGSSVQAVMFNAEGSYLNRSGTAYGESRRLHSSVACAREPYIDPGCGDGLRRQSMESVRSAQPS